MDIAQRLPKQGRNNLLECFYDPFLGEGFQIKTFQQIVLILFSHVWTLIVATLLHHITQSL